MSSPLSRLRRGAAAIAVALALGATLSLTPPAGATPPSIPSPAEAKGMLAELVIAPEGSLSEYSRTKFPHWTTVSGTCNTREWVLRRDGDGVQTGPPTHVGQLAQPLRRRHLVHCIRCGHRPRGAAGGGMALRCLGVDSSLNARSSLTI